MNKILATSFPKELNTLKVAGSHFERTDLHQIMEGTKGAMGGCTRPKCGKTRKGKCSSRMKRAAGLEADPKGGIGD